MSVAFRSNLATWAAVMGFVSHTGCADDKSSLFVAGIVTQETGQPIYKASLTILGHKPSTASDINGKFWLRYDGKLGDEVMVSVQAAGFARAVRRVRFRAPEGIPDVQVGLRPIGQLTQIAMPAAGQTTQVTLTHADSGVRLIIPEEAFVDANGQRAQGVVDVAMTFWDAVEATTNDTTPAPLWAVLPSGELPEGGLLGLRTFGMTEIEVSQRGRLLQVASDKTLTLVATVPPDMRQASPNTGGTPDPRLFWLNPQTGFWQEEVGASVYDPNTGQMTANLQHLSIYNVDEYNRDWSGCFRGRVIDGDGLPVSNARITYDIRARRGDWRYIDRSGTVRTNAQGNYCQSLPWSGHVLYNVQATARGLTADTSTSPAPPGEVVEREVHAIIQSCSTCSGVCPNATCSALTSDPNAACWNDPSGDLCDANAIWRTGQYKPTNVCGNCWPLRDLVLDACAGKTREGGACSNNGDCCAAIAECMDGVCVPK